MRTVRRDAVAAHVAECEACRALPPSIAKIGAALDAVPVEVDAAALSRRTVARVAPLLAARARAAFWARLACVLGVALMPLPVLIAVDVVLLAWLYGRALAWLPSGLATYLIGSYAAMVGICLGLTFAAIPLLIGRGIPARGAAGFEGEG